jgi:hypothetical protein
MKISFVPTIIALALSSLFAYGFYCFHAGQNKLILSVGSFVLLSVTLVITIGSSFELQRTTNNIKVVASIFFAIALISNLVFAFIKFSFPIYFILHGILLLVFILIVYSINKAKQ